MIASGGNFNPTALAAWHLLLSEAAWTHVLDVGANYGEMLANGGLPPKAKIMALEPNPRIRPYLRRTLARLPGDVAVIAAAASDSVGRTDLLVHQGWSGLTRLRESMDGPLPRVLEPVTVPTTTLAALFRSLGPLGDIRAAVKIDVEGHEIAVLRGATEVLYALGEFAALIEVLHLAPDQLAWLTEHFNVEVYAEDTNAFRLVAPATGTGLAEVLRSGSVHDQDVVLRRRS